RFRMHRRPEWPLVSIRERGFPTIGQLTHSSASLFDATRPHRVVTKWVTRCPENAAHQLQGFEAIRGVNNARTAPLGHETTGESFAKAETIASGRDLKMLGSQIPRAQVREKRI